MDRSAPAFIPVLSEGEAIVVEPEAPVDLSLALSLGMTTAAAGRWLPGEASGALEPPGLVLVYLAGGLPTGWRALVELWRAHVLDIDLLMIVAAIAAAIVGAPFEGAVLLTLFSISTMLEERALGRARRAIEALMALRPGARVPTDGVIVAGRGGIDEANITGESMPVSKEAGAQVFEATVRPARCPARASAETDPAP